MPSAGGPWLPSLTSDLQPLTQWEELDVEGTWVSESLCLSLESCGGQGPAVMGPAC
jgi:hypothetical protein